MGSPGVKYRVKWSDGGVNWGVKWSIWVSSEGVKWSIWVSSGVSSGLVGWPGVKQGCY